MTRHIDRRDDAPAALMADFRVDALRSPNASAQIRGDGLALVCTPAITPVQFGQNTRLHLLVSFETPADASAQFWAVSASVCPDSAVGARGVQVPEREVRAWLAAGWPGAEDLGVLAGVGAATHMELQVDELGAPERRTSRT